jgi:hypothetical protein
MPLRLHRPQHIVDTAALMVMSALFGFSSAAAIGLGAWLALTSHSRPFDARPCHPIGNDPIGDLIGRIDRVPQAPRPLPHVAGERRA